MTFDETWIVNAPFGQLSALDVRSGDVRWSTNLADALADEIPRRLEPVLRGGALFVPASSVHVVRPADGQKLSASLPCDLVPDLMRVDERGWVYVAEESGYLAGYAPKPMLTLVGGAAPANQTESQWNSIDQPSNDGVLCSRRSTLGPSPES